MADDKRIRLSRALDDIAGALQKSYTDGIGVNPDNDESFPRRDEVIEVTEKLLELIFPGFDRASCGAPSTEALLREVYDKLVEQICRVMRSSDRTIVCDCKSGCRCKDKDHCSAAALTLLHELPKLREIIKKDVAAGYAGDPAATSFDEIVLSRKALIYSIFFSSNAIISSSLFSCAF